MSSTFSSPVKRHVPAEFDDNDSENIDPLMFFSSSKKSKNFEFNSPAFEKPPRFSLHTAPSYTHTRNMRTPQSIGRKRKAEDTTATPEVDGCPLKRHEPSSAPAAPAGRSPKHKRIGILSKRRATASKYGRVNPPSSDLKSGLPFSIDAALASTVPMKSKPKSSSKGWNFDIYEDSPDDEMANLMEHSTCTLDISDDESRRASKEDRDNKENIPPAEYQTSSNHLSARRDMMTDDVRSPLGDLDAKDYYAAGCDASSFIIVPAEDDDDVSEKANLASNDDEIPSPSRRRSNAVTEPRQGWEDILAQVTAKDDPARPHASETRLKDVEHEAVDIQIWESGSAKGDDDVLAHDTVAVDSAQQAGIIS